MLAVETKATNQQQVVTEKDEQEVLDSPVEVHQIIENKVVITIDYKECEWVDIEDKEEVPLIVIKILAQVPLTITTTISNERVD